MIKLKGELEPRPRRRLRLPSLPRLPVLFLVLVVVGLGAERWRGQRALKEWKVKMEAKGEVFDPGQLWPKPSRARPGFSGQLRAATSRLGPAVGQYAGFLSGMVSGSQGEYRRGSQEPNPPLSNTTGETINWNTLETSIKAVQGDLAAVREIMKDPPKASGFHAMDFVEGKSVPSFVGFRVGAQSLHAEALNALHQGDLSRALESLIALRSLGTLYEEDPSLVSFMMRIAVVGLSVDTCWDAVQAEGWTEPQLAALQQSGPRARSFLAQLPHTMEAERAVRSSTLQWFRSHSYGTWIELHREFYASFGAKLPATSTYPFRLWREWCFHPLWSLAWADQDDLAYLQQMQSELDLLREGVERGSCSWLQAQVDANHKSYAAPFAAWRFYFSLPLFEGSGGAAAKTGTYPYADFSRSRFITMQNLTLLELLNTSIALKRCQLKRGKPPSSLDELMPDFLPERPLDFMDGQPLRYRLDPDGSSVLYSVGEDGVDDAGNPLPSVPKQEGESRSRWAGRDWVWPRANQRPAVPVVSSTRP